MKLILGPGPSDSIPTQGPRRAFKLMADEWNDRESFGVLRIGRLILLLTGFLFLQMYLDWMLSRGKETVDPRIIGVWRDALYVLRLAVWPIILMTGVWKDTTGVVLLLYLMADITRGLLGGTLAWGRHSIDPTRSVLWALINYAELVLGFAALYLHCDCFNCKLTGVTHAVYFSAVTAATVGFGDMYPTSAPGQRLVTAQIGLFFLFVALVLGILLSRLPRDTRKS